MLTRTRFFFWVFAVFILAVAAVMLVVASQAPIWLRALAALAIVWIAERDLQIKRSTRNSLVFLPLDAAALLALAAANGANATAGVFFLGVFYRSLYGERRHVVATALAYLGAYVVTAFVFEAGGVTPIGMGLDQSIGLLFSALVMRVVADSLRREERTRAREGLLREVGAELVSAHGCDEICGSALAAALSVVSSFGEARVAIWRDEGDRLRAVAAVGDRAEMIRGTVMDPDALVAEELEAIRAGRFVRIDPRCRPRSDSPDPPFPMQGEGSPVRQSFRLVVPLQTQDEALGAMVTSSNEPLSAEIEDRLRCLASLVALALESEQLTADLQRAATQRVELRERVKAEREKRQLQERLQHAQRLESVGALAAGVAHDFNNLLAVILNYAGLVRDELPLGSQSRSDVDEIADAAERGARLTEQLLAFGQRKIGETEMLDVGEVIAGMHTLLDRPLGPHIQFRYQPGRGLWPVEADRADIEQIVLNLVVNSRDAVGTGGRITAVVENVELSADQTAELDVALGRYVRVSVVDDGCGIDADTLPHVWEPFFTTHPPGEGSGLGLATVYGIARQAGGGVAISSTPGGGTQVDVYMPATECPLTERDAPSSPQNLSRLGARILLVEDQPSVRDVVRRILERAGYEVLLADCGERALELTRGGRRPLRPLAD